MNHNLARIIHRRDAESAEKSRENGQNDSRNSFFTLRPLCLCGECSGLGLLLSCSLLLFCAEVRPAGAATANVAIADFSFSPVSVAVNAGDTVTWKNNGAVTHSTTSDTGAWNSGSLAPGASFSFTFATTGTFPYHDEFYTSMTASVTVNQGGPGSPSITSPLTAGGAVGVAFSYQIKATNSPTSYNAAGLPSWATVKTSTGEITGTPNAAGSTYVTLSATNSAGTGVATLAIAINPPAPAITSATTVAGTVGAAFSYQITASNSPTSYNAAGLPSWAAVNTGTGLITGTPNTAGSPNVTISATNAGGTGSATLTITIGTPAAPVITGPTTATGTAGVAFSYQIAASNSPAGYNATGLPSWAAVNTSTGLITGTPDAAATTNVMLSATNAGGTGSATLAITISLPPAPAITSATTAAGTVGTAFSYQIAASNSPASYNATGLPSWAALNTGTGAITGTPDTAATTNVTISATNAGGTGSATLTITVALPLPPVINSAATAAGMVGTAFSYQIAASNNPTSYNATGLPSWAAVNTSTGAITGTPDAPGTTNVTTSAANAGGTGSGTLAITIALPPLPAPAFSPGAGTYIGAQAVTISCATNGATIYYTTDGSMPTASSLQFTAPIEVTAPATLLAFATKPGFLDSPVAGITYTVYLPNPGGSGAATPNTNATATNPLDGTTVTVAATDGGVVILQVTQNGGALPAGYTVSTDFEDVFGKVLSTVPGPAPACTFSEPGMYLAVVTLTGTQGSPPGTVELALPISAAHSGLAEVICTCSPR
ncbi:MAG: putative Ig domain-containing protein [Planctomycetota bacterium]